MNNQNEILYSYEVNKLLSMDTPKPIKIGACLFFIILSFTISLFGLIRSPNRIQGTLNFVGNEGVLYIDKYDIKSLNLKSSLQTNLITDNKNSLPVLLDFSSVTTNPNNGNQYLVKVRMNDKISNGYDRKFNQYKIQNSKVIALVGYTQYYKKIFQYIFK